MDAGNTIDSCTEKFGVRPGASKISSSGPHHQSEKALENFCLISLCSSISLLSVHTVFCDCLLSVNICQPLKEAYLKSEKVNFQHYSSIPGAQICRGKELRDGHLNFHRRDSEYLLWFELEPQKYQLPPLSPLLTLHATSLLSDIFTIPPIKMLAPSVASF